MSTECALRNAAKNDGFGPRVQITGLIATTLITGVIGFYTGISYREFSPLLEPAQLLTGVVQYPADHPTSMTHATMWCLPNQLTAALIWFEVPQRTISMVISGLMTMICFQALAMTTFAVGGNALVATLSALLIYVVGATDFGITYNVHLVSPEYGTLGPGFALLVVALWGNGLWRLASFCLGISIAIHPVVGIWCLCATIGGLVLSWRSVRAKLRRLVPSFCVGLAVTGASFACHPSISTDLQSIDGATASAHLRAFAEHWDYHRAPVSLWHPGMAIGLAALGVSMYWSVRKRGDLPERVHICLHIVAVTSFGGLLLALLGTRPLDIPEILLRAIPGRHINHAILSYPALVLGMVCCGNNRLGKWLLLAVVVLLLGAFLGLPTSAARAVIVVMLLACGLLPVIFRQLIQTTSGEDVGWACWVPTILLFAVAVFTGWSEYPKKLVVGISLLSLAMYLIWGDRSHWSSVISGRRLRALAVCVALVGGLGLVGNQVEWRWQKTASTMLDWSTDPFFARVSRQQGVLLAHRQIDFPQIKVRRPSLLSLMGLDRLPYQPASGPAMNRILKDVYGLDVFNPDPNIAGFFKRGEIRNLPETFPRELWEQRTADEWQVIAARHQVTGILVLADWNLDLPVACENGDYKLFSLATPSLPVRRSRPGGQPTGE